MQKRSSSKKRLSNRKRGLFFSKSISSVDLHKDKLKFQNRIPSSNQDYFPRRQMDPIRTLDKPSISRGSLEKRSTSMSKNSLNEKNLIYRDMDEKVCKRRNQEGQEVKVFKSKILCCRQYETQLKQTYRVLNYYQGKIKYLEKTLDAYESIMTQSRKDQHLKIDMLLNQQRKQFMQVSATNQEMISTIRQLDKQLKLSEHKAKTLMQKLSLVKRKTNHQDDTKQDSKNLQRVNNEASLKHFLQQISLKISQMEHDLESIRLQNQRLSEQNQQSKLQNSKLLQEISRLRETSLTPSSQISIDQRISLENCQFEDKRKKSKHSSIELSTKVSQLSLTQNEVNRDRIIRKLRFNLMRSQLGYDSFIKKIAQRQPTLSQQLCFMPYRLSDQQAEQFYQYLTHLSQNKLQKILRKQIASYPNVPGEKGKSYLVRISNVLFSSTQQFKGREEQTNLIFSKQQVMEFGSIQQFFRNWGLTKHQLDYIALLSYQLTSNIQQFNFAAVTDILLRY